MNEKNRWDWILNQFYLIWESDDDEQDQSINQSISEWEWKKGLKMIRLYWTGDETYDDDGPNSSIYSHTGVSGQTHKVFFFFVYP